MEFNEFVMACGQALIFYAVYKLTRFILGFFEIVKDINETGDNVKKYLSSIIHAVKSEKHGDVIYFFEEKTNKFIAQGRNDDELIAALKARWRDHIFIVGERHYMAGPDFKMQEIKDPDEIGKMLAEKVINK
jgi:hypothetical protein